MKGKRRGIKKKLSYFEEEEFNGEFYYIVGYTSNGVPFGITWDEAFKEGIIELEEYNKYIGYNENEVFW